jgi:hypothetical protein
VDKLLHEWQLKYHMIGWSGGFMNVGLFTRERHVSTPPGRRLGAKRQTEKRASGKA